MGNNKEDYRAAIGLFNTKKRCLYGMVNFRAESYQQIMLTNLQCSIFVISLFFPQSTIPEINIVFLLFVLQFILIKGDVETHPGPGTYNSNQAMETIISLGYILGHYKIQGVLMCVLGK
jgi:hypothetical protein